MKTNVIKLLAWSILSTVLINIGASVKAPKTVDEIRTLNFEHKLDELNEILEKINPELIKRRKERDDQYKALYNELPPKLGEKFYSYKNAEFGVELAIERIENIDREIWKLKTEYYRQKLEDCEDFVAKHDVVSKKSSKPPVYE